MRYRAVLISHGGKIRTKNEDNAYLEGYYRKDDTQFLWDYMVEKKDSILAAVFDGMGGESQGEVASHIAARNMYDLKEKYFSQWAEFFNQNTNKEIISYANGRSMGTTYVTVSVEDNVYYFSNLGDSRGYLFRQGMLEQMTKDHNMVQNLLQNGILTEEQARKHPDRHSLYQFLGMKEEDEEIIPEPFIAEAVQAEKKDLILLCSDGLTEMVEEKMIQSILKKEVELGEKAKRLLDEALKNGGHDNVTIILIETLEG